MFMGDGLVEIVADTIRRKLNYYSAQDFSVPALATSLTMLWVVELLWMDKGRRGLLKVESYNDSLLRLDSDTDTIGTFFQGPYINFTISSLMQIIRNGSLLRFHGTWTRKT